MLPCCGATKLFHLSCKDNNHYLHFKLFVKFFLQLFFNRVHFQMILLFNCLKLIVVEITDFFITSRQTFFKLKWQPCPILHHTQWLIGCILVQGYMTSNFSRNKCFIIFIIFHTSIGFHIMQQVCRLWIFQHDAKIG